VVFGDARRGMVPAVLIAGLADLAPRRVWFAHRRPRGAAVRWTRVIDFDVVAVSEHVASGFRGWAPGRVDVMYGLPNADRFHPPTAPRADDGLIHFVLLGRLPNISKGEGRALEAWRRLPASLRERCRLHLASYITPTDPPAPGVEAHHWIPSDEIPGFLRGMDAMLALSSNETFSQAIVQGMLTGLPVVATSLPVYVEKLDTGAGFVADDPGEIAARMEELAGDAGLRARMGAEGRRVALERYVWDTDRFLDELLFPEP
jgi:glycosyltransferase involved in cell wall biosynthesis